MFYSLFLSNFYCYWHFLLADFRSQKSEITRNILRTEEDRKESLDNFSVEFSSLQMYVAGLDIISLENLKLHARIKKLSEEHASMTEYWTEQVDNMKLKSFETRVKLEDVFRTTIKVFLLYYWTITNSFVPNHVFVCRYSTKIHELKLLNCWRKKHSVLRSRTYIYCTNLKAMNNFVYNWWILNLGVQKSWIH